MFCDLVITQWKCIQYNCPGYCHNVLPCHCRKAVNNAYEEYVLSVGDFDERIFLDDDADEEIGTPAKSREDVTGELTERMQQRTSLQQHVNQVRKLLFF